MVEVEWKANFSTHKDERQEALSSKPFLFAKMEILAKSDEQWMEIDKTQKL